MQQAAHSSSTSSCFSFVAIDRIVHQVLDDLRLLSDGISAFSAFTILSFMSCAISLSSSTSLICSCRSGGLVVGDAAIDEAQRGDGEVPVGDIGKARGLDVRLELLAVLRLVDEVLQVLVLVEVGSAYFSRAAM